MEDVMNAKSVVKMGFLAMIAATSLLGAVEGFAADTRRVDVIGTIDETVAQLDSQLKPTEGKVMRVDVIDNIVSKGPAYVYSKSGVRVDVIDSIVSEGPVHEYTKLMSH
jgi:hypothetical protein